MMYALRLKRISSMFIGNDGFCTSSRAAVKLFDTADQARSYVVEWRAAGRVVGSSTLSLSLLEVETKPVIKRIGKEMEEL